MTRDEINALHALIVKVARDDDLKLTPLEYVVLNAARQLSFDIKMRVEFPDAGASVHGSERF